MSFFDFLKPVGKFLQKALNLISKEVGSDVLALALTWVKVAATKYTDNVQRREWVVSILVGRGIPESIARLAVEMAVRLLKKEITDAQLPN